MNNYNVIIIHVQTFIETHEYSQFNEYVKHVKNDIKIAKLNYYFHVFNMHKNNVKQTWRTITETLNKQVNSREIPTKIIHNDETLTNNEEIADCFKSYFANIGVNLSLSFEESDRIPSFETYLGDDNVNPDLIKFPFYSSDGRFSFKTNFKSPE